MSIYPRVVQILLCGLSCWFAGTAIAAPPAPPQMTVPLTDEFVMDPNMRITVKSPAGTLSILAEDELTRTYSWEGSSRSLDLLRRGRVLQGHLDLYYPGTEEHWRPHNGINRASVQEGEMRFSNEAEALRWLNNPKGPARVYRDDGISIAWSKDLPHRQLNVQLWRVLIGGKPPKKLKGSQNNRMWVTYVSPAAPLVAAVRRGSLEQVQELLQRGVKPDVSTSTGTPVLVLAVSRGQQEIAAALLAKGANPNLRDNNGLGQTALLAAMEKLDNGMVELLLQHKAGPNAAYERGPSAGSTALHMAVNIGDEPLVKLLLQHGAKPNVTNIKQETPLLMACTMGQTGMARLLLDKGANVNARDNLGMTPLMHAAAAGQFDLVQLLVQRGANVLARDDMARREYARASFAGDVGTMQKLQQNGRLKILHEDGLTVLDHAPLYGDAQLHRYLKQKMAEARGKGKAKSNE